MRIARPIALLSCLTALALLTVTGGSQEAARITVEGLLRQMVDMERLSTVADPQEESDQQSSYDRASKAPDQDGWFANGDRGQFIRQEQNQGRTEYVMAEMDGPGAILRLWSANPDGGGNIRIYIDTMENPALEADFLALTSAQMPEFPAPFSGRRSMGANLYFPIPYQQRCKVTVDKNQLYYHVGYRTFPPGTQVQPFSMGLLPPLRETMDAVAKRLAQCEPLAPKGATFGGPEYDQETTLRPGRALTTVLRENAPGAIYRMTLNVDVPEHQLFAALRECLLTITFDDEKETSVWCPLGDFFGSQPGLNPYHSLPVGMNDDGTCYCNWYMPYRKQAQVSILNESDSPVRLRVVVHTAPAQWQDGRTMYFHAKWRNEWLPADPRFVDWPMLEATGPGRFVGVMLGVMNTQRGWWGEGDEKVWVDDDTFPSFFGTGSEDYFGYAWCNPGLFEHAYHNQSIVTGPGNFGYTAVARYHVLDDIPFDKSIKFYIEKWAAADREYCCTSYWYAVPGATDFFEPIPVEDRRVRPLPEPFKVKGALEGEALEVVRRTGGTTQVQDLAGQFSGGRHLWWLDPEEGSILEVKVPVGKAGRYNITLGLTKSWDYGIHQPLVHGEEAGEPLDLCAPQITPLKAALGEFDLEAGDLRIGLRCVGTNPNAKPVRRMAGLDYILLQPAK